MPTFDLGKVVGEDGYTPQKNIDYFDGYTPQKGVDYWTEEDQKEVSDAVDAANTAAENANNAASNAGTAAEAANSAANSASTAASAANTAAENADTAAGNANTAAGNAADAANAANTAADAANTAAGNADTAAGNAQTTADEIRQAKENGEFDGEDGYTPQKGVDYFDGQNGTSVTVSTVTESTEDGGTNVVTFSDGKTLNVKNGSKGSKGDTYTLTDTDKADIAAAVKASLTTETWSFTLEDDTVVEKAVYVG